LVGHPFVVTLLTVLNSIIRN